MQEFFAKNSGDHRTICNRPSEYIEFFLNVVRLLSRLRITFGIISLAQTLLHNFNQSGSVFCKLRARAQVSKASTQ